MSQTKNIRMAQYHGEPPEEMQAAMISKFDFPN